MERSVYRRAYYIHIYYTLHTPACLVGTGGRNRFYRLSLSLSRLCSECLYLCYSVSCSSLVLVYSLFLSDTLSLTLSLPHFVFRSLTLSLLQ
ncbi:hypothetical protein FKM82_028507 [Ascaphus truei]